MLLWQDRLSFALAKSHCRQVSTLRQERESSATPLMRRGAVSPEPRGKESNSPLPLIWEILRRLQWAWPVGCPPLGPIHSLAGVQQIL